MDDDSIKTLPPDDFGSYSHENPQTGQKLLNRYEIFGINKQGGFGSVFFVIDLETDQKYAVKTFKSELRDVLRIKEQFKAEIDFWINLDPHPNIVKSYFVEFIEDQLHLFMEFVSGDRENKPGKTLRDIIQNLDTDQAINLAYQICLGMEFLNEKGEKVHADLKPENVLITSENVAKVTDFGLASLVKALPRRSAGTLPYMSPEHLFGAVIDERSDIFSFGIMFYEMLTGYLPHPFEIRDLTISEGREELSKFYENDDGTIRRIDDYRSTFWREIQNPDINERLKQLVIVCTLPYSHDRWRSFHHLRKYFEEWFPDKINYRDADVPDNESTDLHSRACYFHKTGQLGKALTVYNQALVKYPDNAELWRDAAYALLDSGRNSEASKFLDIAKKLNPNISIDEYCSGQYMA